MIFVSIFSVSIATILSQLFNCFDAILLKIMHLRKCDIDAPIEASMSHYLQEITKEKLAGLKRETKKTRNTELTLRYRIMLFTNAISEVYENHLTKCSGGYCFANLRFVSFR